MEISRILNNFLWLSGHGSLIAVFVLPIALWGGTLLVLRTPKAQADAAKVGNVFAVATLSSATIFVLGAVFKQPPVLAPSVVWLVLAGASAVALLAVGFCALLCAHAHYTLLFFILATLPGFLMITASWMFSGMSITDSWS